MDVLEKLGEAGLTGNEAKVYLELIKKGKLSANQISKNIGMDRTLVYTVLNHLIEKGQITSVIVKNKKVFLCEHPENLSNTLKAKSVIINELIGELKDIKKEEQIEAEIEVFEGKEGIRSLFNLALKEKELCSYGSTGKAFYEIYESPAIVKEAKKRGIKIKIIGNKELKGTEAFEAESIDYRYLDITSEATTSIFGDYVSIHIIKGKPLIVLIKNKYIAQSYRNNFDFLWKFAKK